MTTAAPGTLNSDGDFVHIPSAATFAGRANNRSNPTGRAITKAHELGVNSLTAQELEDAARHAESVDSGRMGKHYPADYAIAKQAQARLV